MPNPKLGDSVWVSDQGNGEIRHIDWHDKEIVVYFHHTQLSETYEWDAFTYFHERTNQWRIL